MENEITHSVSIVEKCVVTPASSSPTDVHSPLTFLDMQWMFFNNIQRLLFYHIPNLSRSQFLGHIFPTLKQSVSLTLDHFPLAAGNLIIPPNTNSSLPEICFRNGDGVTLICAECDGIDFNHLVRYDERDCDAFYPLLPELKASSDQVITSTPVLALQVTLFPGAGISVGYSFHHALGDARSIFMLINTWSKYNYNLSHNKIVSDESQLVLELPVFDRNLISADKKGIARIICDQWHNFVSNTQGNSLYDAIEKPRKVRKTFIISSENVKKLKNKVHVSSFVAIIAYIWTCLVKSRLTGKTEGDRREHVVFNADCRERTDPVIPANYFGNCLKTLTITVLNGGELAEDCGFRRAAELLATAIKEKLGNKDAVFGGEENNMEIFSSLNMDRCLTVAGSTRQNFYSLDFGWGIAVKNEIISIDCNGAVSMSGCRDSDGAVEVGLALPVPQMKAFSGIFMEGLNL